MPTPITPTYLPILWDGTYLRPLAPILSTGPGWNWANQGGSMSANSVGTGGFQGMHSFTIDVSSSFVDNVLYLRNDSGGYTAIQMMLSDNVRQFAIGIAPDGTPYPGAAYLETNNDPSTNTPPDFYFSTYSNTGGGGNVNHLWMRRDATNNITHLPGFSNTVKEPSNGIYVFANGQVSIGTTSANNSSATQALTVSGLALGLVNEFSKSIEFRDENASIVGFNDEGAGNYSTKYYMYGGTVAGGGGHRFYTGNVKVAQTEKLQIADNAVVVKNVPVIIPSYTVATLPAASIGAGAMAYVTDSNTTTFNATVAGGGANKIKVTSDGTNWKVG